MNRRSALTTLSGAALSGVAATTLLVRGAAAQSTTPPPATEKPIGGNRYETQTLETGTLSKQESELAVSRASNPKVKEFASFEVAEQTAIAQVLTDENNPPPAPLQQTDQGSLQRLQSAEGAAFDREYVQAQIAGHQKLLEIQQAYLNSKPPQRDREHIAVLARTVIEMHLTMLNDLQKAAG